MVSFPDKSVTWTKVSLKLKQAVHRQLRIVFPHSQSVVKDSRGEDVSNTENQAIVRLGTEVGDSALLGLPDFGSHFDSLLVVEKEVGEEERKGRGRYRCS